MDSPGAVTRQQPLRQPSRTYRLHCGRSARRFSTPWLSRSACRSPRSIAYEIRSHRANDVGTRPGSPPGAVHRAQGPSEEASPPVPAESTCEPRSVRCPQRSPQRQRRARMGRRRRLGTPAACTFTPDVRSRTGESTDGSRGASNIRGRRIGQVIRGRRIG